MHTWLLSDSVNKIWRSLGFHFTRLKYPVSSTCATRCNSFRHSCARNLYKAHWFDRGIQFQNLVLTIPKQWLNHLCSQKQEHQNRLNGMLHPSVVKCALSIGPSWLRTCLLHANSRSECCKPLEEKKFCWKNLIQHHVKLIHCDDLPLVIHRFCFIKCHRDWWNEAPLIAITRCVFHDRFINDNSRNKWLVRFALMIWFTVCRLHGHHYHVDIQSQGCCTTKKTRKGNQLGREIAVTFFWSTHPICCG